MGKFKFRVHIKDNLNIDIKAIGIRNFVIYYGEDKIMIRKRNGRWKMWGKFMDLHNDYYYPSGSLWNKGNVHKTELANKIGKLVMERYADYKVDMTILGVTGM